MRKKFLFLSCIVLSSCSIISNDNDSLKADDIANNLNSITVIGELTKTEYLANEDFDNSGITVVATYNDGKTEILNNYTTNFSFLSGGLNKNVIVSYGGKSATIKNTINKATYNLTEIPKELSNVYGSYKGNDSKHKRYYKFGDFPQTYNFSNIAVSSVMASNGYYIGNDGNYYAKVDNLYYKVEPIKWRVLTDNYDIDGKAGNKVASLLLAENILTAGVPFYNNDEKNRNIKLSDNEIINNVYPNNYYFSAIRAYLNGTCYYGDEVDSDGYSLIDNTYKNKGFLQIAFTQKAQALIKSTLVDNSEIQMSYDGINEINSDYKSYDSNDKIFLLSEYEVRQSDFGFSTQKSDENRLRYVTNYAEYATKAKRNSSIKSDGNWWLRSPYYKYNYYVRHIYLSGDSEYINNVTSIWTGIVPALCISLSE